MGQFSPMNTLSGVQLPTLPSVQQPSPLQRFANPPAGPSGAENAVSTLAGILQGISGYNDRKSQREQEKIQTETMKQDFAKKQLAQLTQIIQSDPSKQSDPKIMARARQLAAAAGLPDPVTKQVGTEANPDAGKTTDGGTGPSAQVGKTTAPGMKLPGEQQLNVQPTLPKETLDMSVLAPKPDIMTAPEAERQALRNMPAGPQKTAAYSRYSNVDPAEVASGPVFSVSERLQANTLFHDTVTKLATGVYTGSDAKFALDALQPLIQSGVITSQMVEDLTHSESIIGPMVDAKMKSIAFLNLDKKALADYRAMLTKEMPRKLEAQITQGQERVDIAQQNANTRAVQVKNQNAHWLNADDDARKRADAAVATSQAAVQSSNIRATLANQKTLNDSVTQLNKSYNEVSSTIRSMITAGQDPGSMDDPNSLVYQAAEIKQQLDAAMGVKSQADALITKGPQTSVQQASGNKSVQIGPQPPTGVGTKGAPVPGEPGYTFTGEKRGNIWVVTNGKQIMGYQP